jgi:hypothetical protein
VKNGLWHEHQGQLNHASNFAGIWGFKVPRFHPSIANLFLQELILAFFVERRPAILSSVLGNHVRLGAHSDIIVYLKNGIIYEYRWGHERTRPFGIYLPMGCPKCGCLQSWKPLKWTGPKIAQSAIVYCSTKLEEGGDCVGTVTLDLSGLHRVTKRGLDAGGEWYGSYVNRRDETHPLWWSYKEGVLTGDVGRGD